jgi:hypothetical protein
MCPSHSTPQARPHGRVVVSVDRADSDRTDRVESAMHSFVDNYYAAQFIVSRLDDTASVTDVNGTSRSIPTTGNDTWTASTTTRTEIGIGSGTAGFSQSDTTLGSLISRDNVSNQTLDKGNRLIRMSASASISSSTTVAETGLFWNGVIDTGTNRFRMLWERTVLDNSISVASGDTVSTTYELTWDAP